MVALSTWPLLNACLNGTSALFISSGFVAIRCRRIAVHRACMLAACATSVVFLVSYLLYHHQVGSTAFTGQGAVRVVYFTVLISHTVLAMVIVPLVVMTLYRAWREQWPRHRRLARWTLPLWLYVSVTGVVIYIMLYQL